MRYILRTRCGCERVIGEGMFFIPYPREVIVPLGIKVALHDPGPGDGTVTTMPTRKFVYYKRDGEDVIFHEED